MARSSECREQYAQKVLDTADIVREAIFNSDLAKPIQSYSRYQLGISEKTITGMTQNQIVCK
jgi:hypothetical protein